MPNREKWADFRQFGSVQKPHKQHGFGEVVYAQFQCPYECGMTIELPETNIKSKKGSKCREHLMLCQGPMAENDDRICQQRKIATESKKRKRELKCGRGDEIMGQADTTLALRAEITTLQASKDALAHRNDGLQGRVQDLESQMNDMQSTIRHRDERDRQRDLDSQQLHSQMKMLEPLVPLVQAITKELGLSLQVPPAAPAATYVERIKGLRKAIKLAEVMPKGKDVAHLERENQALRREKEKLIDEVKGCRTQKSYWELGNRLFQNPKDSLRFLRKVMRFVHPDKQPEHEVAAHALQSTLNFLVGELRKEEQKS